MEIGVHQDEHDTFTVKVGSHRMLTVNTNNINTITSWLKEVKKNSNTSDGKLVVGVGVTGARPRTLTICAGAHTLLCPLPESGERPSSRKALDSFFSSPKVTPVGTKMHTLSEIMTREGGVTVSNPIDLTELAARKLRGSEVDLSKLDLHQLAKVVLGKGMYLVEPEDEPEKEEKKVLDSAVDGYIRFLLGVDLLQRK